MRISKFTMNLYYYFPLSKNTMYDDLFSGTDVGLNDYYMEDVGVYSNKSNFNFKINNNFITLELEII